MLSQKTLAELEIALGKSMVFNVMGKNCDDHNKNFSFLLKDGSNWELTPACDATIAHNPDGEWAHQRVMSVNGKFKISAK